MSSIKEQLMKERKHTISQVVEMFPRLKNQEEKILLKLEENDRNDINKTLVFETILINNKKFYKDNDSMIYDSKMDLVGICKNKENILFADIDNNLKHIREELKNI